MAWRAFTHPIACTAWHLNLERHRVVDHSLLQRLPIASCGDAGHILEYSGNRNVVEQGQLRLQLARRDDRWYRCKSQVDLGRRR